MIASPKHSKYFKKPIVLEFAVADWASAERVFEEAIARKAASRKSEAMDVDVENVDPNIPNTYDNYLLGMLNCLFFYQYFLTLFLVFCFRDHLHLSLFWNKLNLFHR